LNFEMSNYKIGDIIINKERAKAAIGWFPYPYGN